MTKKRALTWGLHRDPEHGRLKAEGLVREWLGEVGQGGAQALPLQVVHHHALTNSIELVSD